MKKLRALTVNLWREEDGAEVIEYSLILGMLTVAVIGAVSVFGQKIADQWNAIANADF